jgi:hypothetical protein
MVEMKYFLSLLGMPAAFGDVVAIGANELKSSLLILKSMSLLRCEDPV